MSQFSRLAIARGRGRVTSPRDLELLRADARYYRDRVALLRAKRYRWGQGSSPRLRELERKLEHAEQRLGDERRPHGTDY
jgi:hypothetical protein